MAPQSKVVVVYPELAAQARRSFHDPSVVSTRKELKRSIFG